MKSRRHSTSAKTTRETPLRIGLVRLADAAPYIIAGEMDYYKEVGLEVQLSWELGWASIKHKIAYGQLDAAHALAPSPISLNLGLSVAATPTRALMATSRIGNAITLSNAFHERGVYSTDDLRQEVRSMHGKNRYTFGVVSLDSTHNILLRSWLKKIGINPDKDVRIVVVPPGQALRNLRARTLDGYCVGEPWNSLAVREQLGWCPALSQEIEPCHLEKVLMAREDKVEAEPEHYRSLVKALKKASEYCAAPENIMMLSRKMRKNTVLGTAAQGLEKTLRGEFDRGDGKEPVQLPVIQFCNEKETAITATDVAWIFKGMADCGLLSEINQSHKAALERAYLGKF